MSENQSEKIVIGDVEYELGTMPPTTALPVMAKLGNIIGNGAGDIDLGDIMKLKDIDPKDPKLKLGKNVLSVLMKILKALNGDDLLYIIRQCQPYIHIRKDGQRKRCNIDSDFNGKTLDLLKVIGNFLKYNFKDFFQGSL